MNFGDAFNNATDVKEAQVAEVPTVVVTWGVHDESFFDKEKVLLLLTDSTNIENEGYSIPESRVHEGLGKLIRQGTGRIIISAFASSITRLMKIVEIAESLGKKIVLDGRSLKTNMEVCEQSGLFKPKKGTIIPVEEADNYPPNKVIVLMTGAQGEEFASLNRAANKTHKKFTIRKGDTIILSASIEIGRASCRERVSSPV